MSDQSQSNDPLAAFGPNEWLVDELYEQYKQDKNSVDKAWWDFFADYRPTGGAAQGTQSNGANAATKYAAGRRHCRCSSVTPRRRPTSADG